MDLCNSSPQTHLYIFFVQCNVPGKYVPARDVKVAITDIYRWKVKAEEPKTFCEIAPLCSLWSHTESKGQEGIPTAKENKMCDFVMPIY